jgi:hypothetical protein
MVNVFLLVLSLPLAAEETLLRHVRTTEPEIQTLIDQVFERSATFQSLIHALNDTDVIVYIETSVIRTTRLRGHLLHRVVAQGTHRYLRLRLSPNGAVEQRMGVIAHELQHALEIARAREVGRSKTIDELFVNIGFTFGSRCSNCYETVEAMSAERKVREELRANRSSIGQP